MCIASIISIIILSFIIIIIVMQKKATFTHAIIFPTVMW